MLPQRAPIARAQSWHLPGSVPHARPVVDPTAGSTPLSQQPQQQHKDSSSPSQQQPPPPTPPPPSPVAAPHLPAHDFCPRLTAELLRKQAQRGAVMVAYTEFEDFKLYGRTFLHHLKVRRADGKARRRATGRKGGTGLMLAHRRRASAQEAL